MDKYDIEHEKIIDTPRFTGDHSDWMRSIELATNFITIEGLWLEFGVFQGASIDWIAQLTPDIQ